MGRVGASCGAWGARCCARRSSPSSAVVAAAVTHRRRLPTSATWTNTPGAPAAPHTALPAGQLYCTHAKECDALRQGRACVLPPCCCPSSRRGSRAGPCSAARPPAADEAADCTNMLRFPRGRQPALPQRAAPCSASRTAFTAGRRRRRQGRRRPESGRSAACRRRPRTAWSPATGSGRPRAPRPRAFTPCRCFGR